MEARGIHKQTIQTIVVNGWGKERNQENHEHGEKQTECSELQYKH